MDVGPIVSAGVSYVNLITWAKETYGHIEERFGLGG